MAAAHALVYGLLAATGAAWVLQAATWPDKLTKLHCVDRVQPYSDKHCAALTHGELDLAASQATTAALVVAALVFVGVFVALYFGYVKKRKG